MSRPLRVVQLVGVNAVPLWGVAHEWSAATLLAIYWYESLLGVLLITARIHLHRRLTGKRGHFMVETTVGGNKRYVDGSFLHHFLLLGVLFTAAHGIFLGALVGIAALKGRLDLTESFAQITGSLVATTVSLLIGFAGDLPHIAERPFAWIRSMRNHAIGRTFIVHVTIVVGMLLVSVTAFLWVFVVLKLLFDVGTLLKWSDVRDAPPQWLAEAMKKQQAGEALEDHESYWIHRWEVDSAAAREAEEPSGAVGT